MIIDTVKKLINDLDVNAISINKGEPFFKRDYKPYPFSVERFNKIKILDNERRIAFVDGGSQEIVRTPTLSLMINRVYFNIFNGTKRCKIKNLPQLIEFFSITTGEFIDDYPFYRTKIYPIDDSSIFLLPNEDLLEFRPQEEITIDNRIILDIPRVSPIARRFTEWSLSKHVLLNELEYNDILVMDGTLKTSFKKESKYSTDIYNIAKSKNIIYSGLAKTSQLITTSGISLLRAIIELAEENKIDGSWYYHPIADSTSPGHAAELFAVKLYKFSDRIFRYDIQAEQARKLDLNDINEIMAQLSINSSDQMFPGYPYGLIDADNNSRVRENEIEMYRTLFFSILSQTDMWNNFLREIKSIDTHSIINNFIRNVN